MLSIGIGISIGRSFRCKYSSEVLVNSGIGPSLSSYYSMGSDVTPPLQLVE